MTQLLENAAAGTALILTVVLLRRVLKDRFLPEIRLFLWAACLFRLLTPAAPQSVLSLWGLVSRSAPAAPAPNRPITFSVPRPAPTETATTQANAWSLSSLLPVLKTVLVILWLAVGAILAARYVWSWLSVRREVRSTTLLARPDPRYDPLPRCARLREGPMDGAPLTFGAARPTIVLAPGLSGPQLDCVLAHEGVHARRRANLWHSAMGAVQVIYWWNPAVWLMARLLRRDVELSCDRAALRRLGSERRKDYAKALVSMATQAEGPAFCHTFGRKAVEERVFAIMKFKKTSLLGISLSLALAFGVTAAFASDPIDKPDAPADSQPSSAPVEDGATDKAGPDKLDPNALPESGDSGYYYKDEDGKPVTMELDGEEVSIWIDENGEPITMKDFTPVDPADVDLSKMEEHLAKQVADGEITQAEADQQLADVKEMLEEAKNGDMELWISTDDTGNIDAFCTQSTFMTGSDVDLEQQPECEDPDCEISEPHHHEDGEVVYHYVTLPQPIEA